ncbi:5'-3' exonuclease [Galbitalea sp. SE-J8]|uniref:5'-3' exonuclease n=1 Tax=Galbitalea sp. SE-J8 TaxID=3054952 RepID=UPI00259D0EBA|nr:5'-3' exonuclease [Galbitalea sp. SE-J8]MDM4763700.1 5'-3' exonuclease [Galbitalea sp. SE-J8]
MTTARLMLLDTAAMYFRAFHGVPDTVRSPRGEPVNAVRGLLDMIARLVGEFGPADVVACWDDDWRPAWRVALIPSYKAHRVERLVADGPDVETVPPELTAQVPVIRAVLTALGIPIVGAAGYEADDVIGTIAATASDGVAGPRVDVVTGDRDLFQVVDDARGVRVIYTGRGMSRLEVLTDAALAAKYGVSPAQYPDFATLRGDASDGLPGVAGIGEKTAAALLAQHGSLAGVLAAADAGTLAATVTARLRAASGYLAVAPRVVAVARDVPLAPGALDPRPIDGAALAELDARWGLGASLSRVRASLAPA